MFFSVCSQDKKYLCSAVLKGVSLCMRFKVQHWPSTVFQKDG